jgi:hypothetical protein
MSSQEPCRGTVLNARSVNILLSLIDRTDDKEASGGVLSGSIVTRHWTVFDEGGTDGTELGRYSD